MNSLEHSSCFCRLRNLNLPVLRYARGVRRLRSLGFGSVGSFVSRAKAAENEIRMLPRLQHPNVVRFLGVEEASLAFPIFMLARPVGAVSKRGEATSRPYFLIISQLPRCMCQGWKGRVDVEDFSHPLSPNPL